MSLIYIMWIIVIVFVVVSDNRVAILDRRGGINPVDHLLHSRLPFVECAHERVSKLLAV